MESVEKELEGTKRELGVVQGVECALSTSQAEHEHTLVEEITGLTIT